VPERRRSISLEHASRKHIVESLQDDVCDISFLLMGTSSRV
jgi:hypothetical protein